MRQNCSSDACNPNVRLGSRLCEKCPAEREFFRFFALRLTTALEIQGAFIPRRVFTQPGSKTAAKLRDHWRRELGDVKSSWAPPPSPMPQSIPVFGRRCAWSCGPPSRAISTRPQSQVFRQSHKIELFLILDVLADQVIDFAAQATLR
jgi:hypothetical protein